HFPKYPDISGRLASCAAAMEACGSDRSRAYCTRTREGSTYSKRLTASPESSSVVFLKIGKATYGPVRWAGSTGSVMSLYRPLREPRVILTTALTRCKGPRMEVFG